jgi:hypothetical protein
MIPPYGIEVSFKKTVHVIFPSPVRYVDLGSADIIAGKANGSENAPPFRNRSFIPSALTAIIPASPGKKSERTVFALPKFTIPDGKHLIVELFEKNGGRHQNFVVENSDIVRAQIINDLKLK